MYADVVVLTYQAPRVNSYTYKIPKDLESKIRPGQLVSVPFGKRNPVGLVLRVRPFFRVGPLQEKIKPIDSILIDEPIMLLYQLKLLEWMAFYYHAPMVNCLRAMMPEIATNAAFAQGVGQTDQGRTLIMVRPYPENIQTLVLVPSINRIPETLAQFRHAKNYVLYHGELTGQARLAVWLKILEGGCDFIFGSRSAIFAPCRNLAKIIIFDEHESAYKDSRSPYFDTLNLAEKISEYTNAKVEIIDSSPKIATYFAHRAAIKIPKVPTKTMIVSMEEERRRGNNLAISDNLSALLKTCVKEKKRALLFLNKKKESGHVFCKTCRFSDFCEKQPEACPNCSSPDIYFNSLNINSLAQTIRKILPDVPINIIGGKLLTIDYRLPVIDIATASVFWRLTPKKYALAAAVAADSSLNIPDINSAETAFTQLTNLKKLTSENGIFLIQTYKGDHPVIKAAVKGDFLSYYNSQISERKALAFPPYALLIKLTIRGKDKKKIFEKAEALTKELPGYQTAKARNLPIIYGPYESVFAQKTPSYSIILKSPTESYNLAAKEKARKKFSAILTKIPQDWQIAVEPAGLN